MSKASIILGVVSMLAFILLALMYLQIMYAALLECPNKVNMGLIPRCVEASNE